MACAHGNNRRDVRAYTRRPVTGAGPLPAPPFVVQLFVWERSVSAVADPDLLEPALGPHPPDTTVRSQVAWIPQLSTFLPSPAPGGTPVAAVSAADLTPEYVSTSYDEFNSGPLPRPLLAARVEPDIETSQSTIVPATAGYLGVENQLYRVEVHAGGTTSGHVDVRVDPGVHSIVGSLLIGP